VSFTVTRVNRYEKDGKVRFYVDLDRDGEKVEAVSFADKAEGLEIGKPLPEGWVLEPPKEAGWKPMLKAPKGGGGFRGRSPEMESFIQERMDRRTALMQAVQLCGENHQDAEWATVPLAHRFYTWLRETVPAVTAAGKPGDTPPAAPSPGTTSAASQGEPAEAAGRGQSPEGEAGGCPPHDLDSTVAPKANRYPCKRCGAWVRP
jgi:hypothetical protein